MSKLSLTKTQINNIENKSMLVLPVANYMMSKNYIYNPDEMLTTKEEFVNTYLPIQKSDKDVWIAEEFFVDSCGNISYKSDVYRESGFNKIEIWQATSQMTKEQSRHTISEILDVRVVMVQDINIKYWEQIEKFIGKIDKIYPNMFEHYYNKILKEHNINRTYEDNDYVFLVEYRY